MTGTVFERPEGSGTFMLKWDIGRDPETGKRRQRYETFRGTKKQAEKRLAQIVGEVGEPDYVDRSNRVLSDWIDAWLALRDGKIGARTLRPTPQAARRADARRAAAAKNQGRRD